MRRAGLSLNSLDLGDNKQVGAYSRPLKEHLSSCGSEVALYPSSPAQLSRPHQYAKLKSANTSGKVILEMTSILLDLVGNLDIQRRQQFFRGGLMWISHCRILDSTTPPRTRGFCQLQTRQGRRTSCIYDYVIYRVPLIVMLYFIIV